MCSCSLHLYTLGSVCCFLLVWRSLCTVNCCIMKRKLLFYASIPVHHSSWVEKTIKWWAKNCPDEVIFLYCCRYMLQVLLEVVVKHCSSLAGNIVFGCIQTSLLFPLMWMRVHSPQASGSLFLIWRWRLALNSVILVCIFSQLTLNIFSSFNFIWCKGLFM